MSLRTFGLPARKIQLAKLNMQGGLALTQVEALAIFNVLDWAISCRSQMGGKLHPAEKRARDKIRRALEIAEGNI